MRQQVIQSYPAWFAWTAMYTAIRYLPAARVQTYSVSERMAHLDEFGVPSPHTSALSWRYWSYGLQTKFRFRRHSALLANMGRRLGAKLVHSHFGPYGWFDMPSVRRIPARHVVSFYAYDINQLPVAEPIWRDRYAELFAATDRVLCESPFRAAAVIGLGCPPEKVRIHHLGVENHRIAFAPRRWSPGTPLRVLIAASFTEKKGIPDALAALALIKNEIQLEVTIIGDALAYPSSQREKQRILETVERYNLKPVVRFLGYKPRARLFEEAYRNHIFILPSITTPDGDAEGGPPATLIEMAATGMPIISTHHCDIPLVIQAGRTGLLAEERDIRGLATLLRWLIRNPGDWQPMLNSGRQHIEREFDAHIQGARLADLYDELILG